ncbi:MAG: hypothetical protein LW709_02690 [Oxalobacteraceae bacterium]|jgi:hypothetical protein|nr:hypothetical protein [Oxalobacteraceae bacterium]MCE2830966.1 hypothetical protein [Oxalobacteraceae bacterium]
MKESAVFVGLLLAVVLGYIAYRLPPSKWREYFSTSEGRGILKGIILAPIVILLIALVLSLFSRANAQGRWFKDAGVFVGLDQTFKQSPQCSANTIDDRGTSNMGFWVNAWQYQNVQVNFKYTHHSCVLGRDRNSYDAAGIELRWTLWKR